MISVLGLWQIFVQLGHKRKQRYTNAFHNWEVKLHVFRRRRKRYVKQSRHWVTVIGWMIRDIFWIFLCECLSRRIYACAGSIIIEWKLNLKRSGNLKDLNKMFGLNLTQRKNWSTEKSGSHKHLEYLYVQWRQRGAWPTNTILTFDKNLTNLECEVAQSSYPELCVTVDFVPHEPSGEKCPIITCTKNLTVLLRYFAHCPNIETTADNASFT